MAKSTSYRCGVKDLYVAYATTGSDNTITYGTPAVLGGTASVSVAYESGENKVYESDLMIRNKKKITGATVTYESRSVALADLIHLLTGQAESTDGDYEESPDDVAPFVAVGWAAPTTDGKYLCTWMYYATAAQGDESYESATDQENTPTDSITFGCIPSPTTGKLRRRKLCANATEMEAFFKSVLKA